MRNLKIKNRVSPPARRVAIAIIVISVLIAGSVGARRWLFERLNAPVETVVSIRDMTQLSRLAGVPLSEVMAQIRSRHVVSSVAVEEDSIQDLVADGQATFLSGAEILRVFRLGLQSHSILEKLATTTVILPDRYYIVFEDRRDFDRVSKVFVAEMGNSGVQIFPDIMTVSVIGDTKDLMELGLGFSDRKIKWVQSYGFGIIPRFRNSVRVNSAVVTTKFSSLPDNAGITTIIFEGTTVLGYPRQLDKVADELVRRGYDFGVIEFADQLGVTGLAKRLPNHIVRVHSFSDAEIENLPTVMVINRYVRAARERNIKVIFLKPYFALGYHSMGSRLVSANMTYFEKVGARLHQEGIEVKRFDRSMSDQYRSGKAWEHVTIGLGVAVLAWALVTVFGLSRGSGRNLAGAVIVALGSGALAHWAHHDVLWCQLMALGAAIGAPTMAMTVFFSDEIPPGNWAARFMVAMGRIISAFLVTLMGAVMVVGLLSDYGFLVGAWHFLGVKFAFIIPIVLTFYFYYIRPRRLSDLEGMARRVLDAPVRYSALFIASVGVVFLAVYIIRSGNYLTVDTGSSEQNARQWLETVFSVRPRTKEILVGYPFLMAALLIGPTHLLNRWRWALLCVGSVAFISVLNSFCHIHSPVELSLYRGVLGIGIGFLVSVAMIIAGKMGLWIVTQRQK